MIKKLFFAAAMAAMATFASAQTMLPYQNPALSADERAEDLISRLSLKEKTQLMMDQSPAIERLGIPAFEWWNEALHGVGRNGTATVFPITMCMASSWNDALLYRVYDAVSDELRVKNTQAREDGEMRRYRGVSVWTPNINIFRDPRWGRGQETYGEDPYLTSRMGVAVVRGLQGPANAKYRKALACAKHFAVHSGPEWNRHSFDVQQLPERDLWETYLPAFKALVEEADVQEVMCAYQRIDGDPCCGNERYLHQILRNDWNYKGLVVSDCWAIRDFYEKGCHEVSPDAASASAKAVIAGTDLECGSAYKNLPQAIAAGAISEEKINESLHRLLKARFELGDFDSDDMNPWTKLPTSLVACNDHKRMALDMARQGIVLLENNGILPLKKDAKVAVVGPNATNETMMWGNYNGFPTETVTLLKGIMHLGKDVTYIGGCGYVDNQNDVSLFPQITNADGTKGMKGVYWNNIDLNGTPVAEAAYTQPLNLNNGGATVFAPGVELTNFSARYQGTLRAEADETLTLSCAADDGVRIIINNDTIYENWKQISHSIKTWSKEYKVKAGKSYDITIEYMQIAAYASINFDIARKVTTTPAEIVAKTANADVVVFCGGISPRLEGEEMKVNAPGFKGGDRTSIELPQAQRDVVAALKAAGRKVVFVNCSGSAMAMAQEKASCDAMLQAWYAGEKGGQALAEILFGDVNPSGKLPITFYSGDSELPDFLDYTMKNRTYRYYNGTPLWAFGHGLSYTNFAISKPKYKNDALTLSVSNTGSVDGTETVQVYIRRIADTDGPKKTLRAFQRVNLKAGETQNVTIALPRDRFECWDASSNTMRVLPGKYEVMVGNSSDDAHMQTIVVTLK